MKNKDLVCKGLLVAIIILIGITVCYYLMKSSTSGNANLNSNPDINETNKDENNDNDESSTDGTSSEDNNMKGIFRKINNYDEFNSLINRNTGVFYVFGRKGCHYCELYTPILEDLADNYNIEIYYIDLALLTSEDYYRVLNTPLMIPSKCHKTGEEVELKEGFGTPLGLFIKSGETYDCVRGYKDKDNLINIFKEINYIK